MSKSTRQFIEEARYEASKHSPNRHDQNAFSVGWLASECAMLSDRIERIQDDNDNLRRQIERLEIENDKLSGAICEMGASY